MVFVSLILAITERGGGYATAGAVIAALTLAAGLALPGFGRLIDRYGQHGVLVPETLAFGVLMLLLTVAVEARGQEWLLVVLAAATGVVMPAAGRLVRARWTKIYQGTDKLRIAYGFESATIETVEIAGPILVTALVTGIGPLAGLAAVLTCALGGTLALAAQRGTEPEPVGRAAGGVGNSLRIPALRALYAARFCVGAVFGAMPVSLIAFATAHHGRTFSGLFLGLWGVTSLIAGLALRRAERADAAASPADRQRHAVRGRRNSAARRPRAVLPDRPATARRCGDGAGDGYRDGGHAACGAARHADPDDVLGHDGDRVRHDRGQLPRWRHNRAARGGLRLRGTGLRGTARPDRGASRQQANTRRLPGRLGGSRQDNSSVTVIARDGHIKAA